MSDHDRGLHIAVLVKQVPNVNGVTIDPASHEAILPTERVMNTYDIYAVSEALELKERHGGTVTVITLGPPGAQEVLMRALATGADEAIHITAPADHHMDSLATARALAGQLQGRGFNLVLAGQSTEDYETGQTGPQVAELLDWPHVTLVTHVELEGDALRIQRDAEMTKEVVSVPLPAVLMVLSGRDGEQRYPTLRGMMAAKKKTIEVVEVDPGHDPPALSWTAPRAVPSEASGVIVRDTGADEAAAMLVTWLKERKLV